MTGMLYWLPCLDSLPLISPPSQCSNSTYNYGSHAHVAHGSATGCSHLIRVAPLIAVHRITVSSGMLSLDNISSNACPWAVCAQLPGEICSRLFALRQHGLPKDHGSCIAIILVLATTQVLKIWVCLTET